MSPKKPVEKSDSNTSYAQLSRKAVLGTLSASTLSLALSGCTQLRIQIGDFTTMQGIVDREPEICQLGEFTNMQGHPKDKKEEVIVDGDPEVGTVYFIGQIHKSLAGDATDYAKERVANFQLRILIELDRLNIAHVFLEGYPRSRYSERSGCSTGDVQYVAEPNAKQVNTYISSLIDPELPHYMTTKEEASYKALAVQHLYMEGGVSLYDYYYPQAQIHGTSSYEEWEDEGVRIKTLIAGKREIEMSYVLDTRERQATREVMGFFKGGCENGKRVALVYGMAHDFADDFKGYENPPRVISISFPALEKAIFGVENPMEALGIKESS